MRQLSPAGHDLINGIAQRNGFSFDATMSMLDAVINGNGSMAQFNHHEFAGSGQWMRGGMTMVSDMFNNYLKGRVDGLCSELADVVANQPDLVRSGSFQSQSQGGYQNSGQQQSNHGGASQQQGGGGFGAASLFVPGTSNDWWPSDLRFPNSTGSQNGVRYAYFAQARRLVIDVASLPVISSNGQPPWPVAQVQNTPQNFAPTRQALAPTGKQDDVFATIERLAELRAKGILSDDEFLSKKAELLSRL